jgi:endonuclease/exonuclease/phosphatase family metal-dependent hydrolase
MRHWRKGEPGVVSFQGVIRVLLSTVLAVVVTTGCAARRSADDAAPFRLKVMAYNIHHCRGMDDVVDAARIAGVIAAVDPDVVSLQEVDVGVRRSGQVDQVAEIARLTGLHGEFGKARDYDGGEYGQAILSRWPIRSLTVRELPGATDGEERIALLADVPGDDRRPDLLFVGTHLHHQAEAHRLVQAELLMNLLADTGGAKAIVSGDMNAMPGSETIQLLLSRWRDCMPDEMLTFPADEPVRKIDYILVPGHAPWRVVRAEVIDEPMASDHRPILVELEWVGR